MQALPAKAPATYDVAVANATGAKTVTSIYTLQTERISKTAWRIWTVHSEGTWEEPGEALTFDSAAPKGSDPWPLTLQHAISTVPVTIAFAAGAPTTLLDEADWRIRVDQALDKLGLPEQARSTREALIDPDGVLADLRRNFPGTPNGTEKWTRFERIAGVKARRSETCSETHENKQTIWHCEGVVQGPEDGAARLMETTSSSTLVIDQLGLVSLEGTYSGTLVMLADDESAVIDRPIAGRRFVSRQ